MQTINTRKDILEGSRVTSYRQGSEIPFRVKGFSVGDKKEIEVLVSQLSEEPVKRVYDMSRATWFNLFPYKTHEIYEMDILKIQRVKTNSVTYEGETEIKYGDLRFFSILLKQFSHGGIFSVEADQENLESNKSKVVYKKCMGRPDIYIGSKFVVFEFRNYKFAIKTSDWIMEE